MSETSDWAHDRAIDARGLQCPLPVLKARKMLLAMKPGERLLVESTDPLSPIDMPAYCNESGNRLLKSEVRNGCFVFLIERVSAPHT